MKKNNKDNRSNILIKNTMLYTISSFGTKIFSFIIVPLYTYYLTTKEYGTYDTIYSIIGLVTPMCILSIHEGILRWLLKSDDKDEVVFSTGMLMYLFYIFITCITLLFIFSFVKWDYSWTLIICLFTSTLNEVMQFSARGMKYNKPFAISGVIQTILMLSLNILFIIGLKTGIIGMLISLAISQLSSSLYLYFILRNKLRIKIKNYDKKLARNMLLYSIMLVPNNISWWIMNSSDRLMLTAMIGSSFTGIYSIAAKFPSLLNMIHTIFYRAWQEQAVLEYDSDTRDKYYTKVFNIYLKICFCGVILLIPISKLYIQFFMSESFVGAYKYLGILMVGTAFCSFSSFYGTGYISAKDTKNATLTTTMGAVINCLINLFLINKIGIWAACLSTLIGYLVTWIVRVYQTKKYFRISVNWKNFTYLLIISSLFSFLVTIESNILTIIMIIIGGTISVIINKKEIIQIINFIFLKLKGGKKNEI